MHLNYNHYVNRMGLAAPYSAQFAAVARPEGGGGDYGPNSGGYDQLGFGTLTYMRDPNLVLFTPPQLAFSLAGSQLQLIWPADHAGWRLQTQTNSPGTGLGTNWATVANSTGTNQIFIPIGATNGSVFFRLIYP